MHTHQALFFFLLNNMKDSRFFFLPQAFSVEEARSGWAKDDLM